MLATGIRRRPRVSERAGMAPGTEGMAATNRRRDASLALAPPDGTVLDVCPPKKGPRDHRVRNTVEPDLFPLASAAHEFKTPLVTMLGYADLLRGGRLGPTTEKQRQVLGEMQESAQRLQRLIEDLLLLARLKDTRNLKRSEKAASEVNEPLLEIFSFWAPVARQKSITYKFCPAPGGPQVCAEGLKLQHIVSNLIDNALKFTPAQGSVRVRVTPCFWERRGSQTGFLFNTERRENHRIENAVLIDVSDSGPGIPTESHEDIFGDFVQLPGTCARGTGLGLAIARRLTEACGGAIWVEGGTGIGSRFCVLLPQARPNGSRKP
jgi:signal transduction histidine kinase